MFGLSNGARGGGPTQVPAYSKRARSGPLSVKFTRYRRAGHAGARQGQGPEVKPSDSGAGNLHARANNGIKSEFVAGVGKKAPI